MIMQKVLQWGGGGGGAGGGGGGGGGGCLSFSLACSLRIMHN